MVTITRHVFINIFRTKHFSAVKFDMGNKKNMSVLVIPKSLTVWKKSWKNQTGPPLSLEKIYLRPLFWSMSYTLSHFENGHDVLTHLYMHTTVLTVPFCIRAHYFLGVDNSTCILVLCNKTYQCTMTSSGHTTRPVFHSSATAIGDNRFQIVAVKSWNLLPIKIKTVTSVVTFKKLLKTYLFWLCCLWL